MTMLSTSFLRAVSLVGAFKHDQLTRCQAALLLIALQRPTCDAGMIPAELCGDSMQICGCATGALIAIGLLEVCGRVRSSSPKANARKVNELRIPNGKAALCREWLARHGITAPEESQQLMAV